MESLRCLVNGLWQGNASVCPIVHRERVNRLHRHHPTKYSTNRFDKNYRFIPACVCIVPLSILRLCLRSLSGPRRRVFKKQLPKVEPLVAKLKEIGAPRCVNHIVHIILVRKGHPKASTCIRRATAELTTLAELLRLCADALLKSFTRQLAGWSPVKPKEAPSLCARLGSRILSERKTSPTCAVPTAHAPLTFSCRDKTPAQVSLNWCITKGAIPIPGAKNIRQVGGALRTVSRSPCDG